MTAAAGTTRAAAPAARKRLARAAGHRAASGGVCRASHSSVPAGRMKPAAGGARQAAAASPALPPRKRARRRGPVPRPALAANERRRCALPSAHSKSQTTAKSMQAIRAAAAPSPMESQARKIAVVQVETPRSWSAPYSASASISTRAVPAASAGRAKGRPTRKKSRHGPAPSERAASNAAPPSARKARRARR